MLQLYKTERKLRVGEDRVFKSVFSPFQVNLPRTMLGRLWKSSCCPHYPFDIKQNHLGLDLIDWRINNLEVCRGVFGEGRATQCRTRIKSSPLRQNCLSHFHICARDLLNCIFEMATSDPTLASTSSWFSTWFKWVSREKSTVSKTSLWHPCSFSSTFCSATLTLHQAWLRVF